jgi:hypothetical protein
MFCCFLFLFAASLFGTIISQVNDIVAQHASMTKELDTILEMYLSVQPKFVPQALFFDFLYFGPQVFVSISSALERFLVGASLK